MKRRNFVALLGAAVTVMPLAAHAQQPAVPRVGYVWGGVRGTDLYYQTGFRQGLADLGYVVGRNLLLEERYADGEPERVPALIAELLTLNVDVLVTPGTPISQAAQRATSTVPIVCMSGDPVRAGLVASLARPGGNITGLSQLSGEYGVKWVELLKEAAPKVHRVAVLWNPDNPTTANQVELMQKAAPGLGIELTALSIRRADIDNSFTALRERGFDGLVVTDDPSLIPLVPRLIEFTAERRLPAIYPFRDSAQRGGLMSYSANLFKLWQRAASYVDRILKGARPAELPVQQTTDVTLNINLKTAKALGLDIPMTLSARADEVIE
ncbi:ABC transporter substrate-binding protein [Bradyrhizobium barranii]|uniref:ABC transporter substrate-binding protein n=1 Tax=Bradyrhizobium TaxID=374 RepID=UPI003F200D7F